jgi:mannose/fructose-specific phosphotransferase system component IIA
MSKYILFVIVIIVSYATGRYMSPEKIKTEVKTVEVEKVVTKVEHKTVKIKENKDGSKETIIVTDSRAGSTTNIRSQDKTKELTVRDKINVSLLAGNSLPISAPIFGASVQKNFIGPITLGAWVLTNKTGGLSVGLNF